MTRKKSWLEVISEEQSNRRKNAKQIKANANDSRSHEERKQEEWKTIISSKQGHFHPVLITKATEKEIGIIKYVKLNNRRIWISAVS